MVSRIEMSLKPLRQPHLLSQEKETGDLGSKSRLDRVGEDSLSTPFLKFLYSYNKKPSFWAVFSFSKPKERRTNHPIPLEDWLLDYEQKSTRFAPNQSPSQSQLSLEGWPLGCKMKPIQPPTSSKWSKHTCSQLQTILIRWIKQSSNLFPCIFKHFLFHSMS